MNDEGLRWTYQGLLARRGEPERSQCPPAERLHELVTRIGPEDARLAVANHVMACPHCLPEFELLRSVDAALPEKKSGSRWLAIAASVALLVAAGILGRQLLQGRGDTLRASPGVRLVVPAEGQQVSEPLTLTWHPVPEAVVYRVRVLTSDGAEAYKTTTSDTTMVVNSLSPGQFIWQVSAEYATGTPLRSRPARFSIKQP